MHSGYISDEFSKAFSSNANCLIVKSWDYYGIFMKMLNNRVGLLTQLANPDNLLITLID
jgi:hypothetical protein